MQELQNLPAKRYFLGGGGETPGFYYEKVKLRVQGRCRRRWDPPAGVTAREQGLGSDRGAGTPRGGLVGAGGHPCPATKVPPAWSPSQGQEPAKEDPALGLSQVSNHLPGWKWERADADLPALADTAPAPGTRSRYASPGDTQAPARGLAPSGPASPPAPLPRCLLQATHWLGAGRSGGSASTGSSRTSRGSRL